MDWAGWREGGNERPNRLPTLLNDHEPRVPRFRFLARAGWRKLLMEIYFPCLLSRNKAMLLIGLTRRQLELLAIKGIIRTYRTKGGQKRYFRDDLIKFINEHNKEQSFDQVQSQSR